MQKIEVAAATVINCDLLSVWLPNEAKIMTAEAKAIELAFGHIKMLKDTHVLIFSDYLPCLQSLHNMNIDHPYISDTLFNYSRRGGGAVG